MNENQAQELTEMLDQVLLNFTYGVQHVALAQRYIREYRDILKCGSPANTQLSRAEMAVRGLLYLLQEHQLLLQQAITTLGEVMKK